MDGERLYTLRQLLSYDGEAGAMLIAFDGVVYDVTDCPHWRSGLHEGQHFPGQDLSSEIENAPHSVEVFSRPCVRRAGLLEAGKD
jgi:predicted heme/steroid binding protein